MIQLQFNWFTNVCLFEKKVFFPIFLWEKFIRLCVMSKISSIFALE